MQSPAPAQKYRLLRAASSTTMHMPFITEQFFMRCVCDSVSNAAGPSTAEPIEQAIVQAPCCERTACW